MKFEVKDIIKILITFIVGALVGFIVFKFGSSSITDMVQGALNGIIWLLFLIVGLLCVIILLLLKRGYTEEIVNNTPEITEENLLEKNIQEQTEEIMADEPKEDI